MLPPTPVPLLPQNLLFQTALCLSTDAPFAPLTAQWFQVWLSHLLSHQSSEVSSPRQYRGNSAHCPVLSTSYDRYGASHSLVSMVVEHLLFPRPWAPWVWRSQRSRVRLCVPSAVNGVDSHWACAGRQGWEARSKCSDGEGATFTL